MSPDTYPHFCCRSCAKVIERIKNPEQTIEFLELFLKKWANLPVWLRWCLYLPTVILVVVVAGFLPGLVTLAMPTESIMRSVFVLIQSAIIVTVFFWATINFAPKAKKFLGWFMFGLLVVCYLISTIALMDDKTIFGDALPPSISKFWAIQNVVWLVSGFVSVIYFSRKIGGKIMWWHMLPILPLSLVGIFHYKEIIYQHVDIDDSSSQSTSGYMALTKEEGDAIREQYRKVHNGNDASGGKVYDDWLGEQKTE